MISLSPSKHALTKQYYRKNVSPSIHAKGCRLKENTAEDSPLSEQWITNRLTQSTNQGRDVLVLFLPWTKQPPRRTTTHFLEDFFVLIILTCRTINILAVQQRKKLFFFKVKHGKR